MNDSTTSRFISLKSPTSYARPTNFKLGKIMSNNIPAITNPSPGHFLRFACKEYAVKKSSGIMSITR